MERDEAKELVTAMVAGYAREDDEDFFEYMLNNVAPAAAMLLAVLAELMKESKDDERTLV